MDKIGPGTLFALQGASSKSCCYLLRWWYVMSSLLRVVSAQNLVAHLPFPPALPWLLYFRPIQSISHFRRELPMSLYTRIFKFFLLFFLFSLLVSGMEWLSWHVHDNSLFLKATDNFKKKSFVRNEIARSLKKRKCWGAPSTCSNMSPPAWGLTELSKWLMCFILITSTNLALLSIQLSSYDLAWFHARVKKRKE